MKNKVFIILFPIIALQFALPNAYAQEKTLIIEQKANGDFHYPVSDYLTVLADPSGNLKIDEVSSASFARKFETNSNQWLSSPVKTYWLKLTVKSELSVDKEFLAYVQGSVVDLYEPIDSIRFLVKRTGLLVPLSQRDQKNRLGHFPYISMEVKKERQQTFFFRVSTKDFPVITPHTNLPTSISSFEYVLQTQRSYFFMFIFVCSILLGLAIYHLVIFIVTREPLYLFFSIFSFCSGIFVAYFKGYVLELILPEHPWIHYKYAFMIIAIGFFLSMLFFLKIYLNLRQWLPGWDKFLSIVFGYIIGSLIISIIFPAILPGSLTYYNVIVLMLFLECLGFVLLYEKHPLAINYLIAFTVLALGLITNGILAITGIFQGVWDFGDIGLMGLQILLAVGLATRINVLNAERQYAQVELIKQLEENHAIQQQANLELENKVKARTLEIQQQNEKLTRLNLLKDKLFSIVTHDIKGPLNELSGTLYMIEKDLLSKEEIKEMIPRIGKNLAFNTTFINDLFIWAKSQMDGATVNQQKTDLKQLIDVNISLLKPISDAKEISIVNLVTEPITIYADVEMIKTVLRNLITNAIKFTRQAGEIKIGCHRDANFVSVYISDNGIGISEDDQKKLFGAQVFTTRGTNNEKGTGLGLLICKEFVEKNGGTIRVESVAGRGSTFTFTIPLS